MAISISYPTFNMATDNQLASKHVAGQSGIFIWAIMCSFLLHALLAIILPNVEFDIANEKPAELKIEILQPAEPIAAPAPEPVKPQAITPVPKKILAPKPKIQPKRQPKKQVDLLPATPPIVEPSADIVPTPQEPIKAESLPAIIATAPKAETKPIFTAPVAVAPPTPPQPDQPPQPSEQDINAALGQFSSTLFRAFAKHKQYPKIAQMRGWQGQCLLEIQIDSAGNVQSTRIKESSGYDALDNQALEMSKKATPLPAPPEALQGRNFTITVPISFKLE